LEQEVRDQYLDILKKALTYSFWDEPAVPMDIIAAYVAENPDVTKFGRIKSFLYSQVLRPYLESRDLIVAKKGRWWPVYAHTMMPMGMLDSLQACIETTLVDEIPGDLIETGVWRGGHVCS